MIRHSALLCSSDHFKSCVSYILFWFAKCKNPNIFVWFSGWTHLNSQRTTALCVKLNNEHVGASSGKYFKRVSHVWEKKKWCIFCWLSTVQNMLLGNFTAPARMWSHYTIIPYKLQCSWRVWTLPVQGREFYFLWWARVVERSLPKNRIEFQRGNKLLGTSSEALIYRDFHLFDCTCCTLSWSTRIFPSKQDALWDMCKWYIAQQAIPFEKDTPYERLLVNHPQGYMDLR